MTWFTANLTKTLTPRARRTRQAETGAEKQERMASPARIFIDYQWFIQTKQSW